MWNPIKAAKDAAEKAGRTVKDTADKAGHAVKDTADKAGHAVKDAADKAGEAANDATNAVGNAAKSAADVTKKGIEGAANLTVDSVKAAANATQDLSRGDFDAIAKEGAKLASSAVENGIPVLQGVAKLADGVTGEIEGQINAALKPLNVKLSDFTGPINKVADELKGVANYLITEVLNEVLKILLLKKAKEEIEKRTALISDVVKYYQSSKLLPEEFYNYLEKSGLGSLAGFEKGGKLSEFPYAKHLGSSYSMGYNLEAGANGLNVDVSPALAVDSNGKAKGIFSYSAGVANPGASQGIQFAYWKSNADKLAGNFWSVSLSGAGAGPNHIGGGVTVSFDLFTLEFQGIAFDILAASSSGPSASIVIGNTTNIH